MKVRSIEQKDYEKVFESDRKVYPTNNPVQSKDLDNWYQYNPEFGMMYETDTELNAMCIAIPLTAQGWTQLTSGKLAEADVSSETIFKNERDSEIGLHMYHVEKFDSFTGSFYTTFLQDLSTILNNLRRNNPKLKIIGFSGLCVTAGGIGLFENKFNCREREFINTEHILRKNGKLAVFDLTQTELETKLDEGYEYVNRCKMLVTYPQEKSIVWKFL
jgi:hypothetical protein